MSIVLIYRNESLKKDIKTYNNDIDQMKIKNLILKEDFLVPKVTLDKFNLFLKKLNKQEKEIFEELDLPLKSDNKSSNSILRKTSTNFNKNNRLQKLTKTTNHFYSPSENISLEKVDDTIEEFKNETEDLIEDLLESLEIGQIELAEINVDLSNFENSSSPEYTQFQITNLQEQNDSQIESLKKRRRKIISIFFIDLQKQIKSLIKKVKTGNVNQSSDASNKENKEYQNNFNEDKEEFNKMILKISSEYKEEFENKNLIKKNLENEISKIDSELDFVINRKVEEEIYKMNQERDNEFKSKMSKENLKLDQLENELEDLRNSKIKLQKDYQYYYSTLSNLKKLLLNKFNQEENQHLENSNEKNKIDLMDKQIENNSNVIKNLKIDLNTMKMEISQANMNSSDKKNKKIMKFEEFFEEQTMLQMQKQIEEQRNKFKDYVFQKQKSNHK